MEMIFGVGGLKNEPCVKDSLLRCSNLFGQLFCPFQNFIFRSILGFWSYKTAKEKDWSFEKLETNRGKKLTKAF